MLKIELFNNFDSIIIKTIDKIIMSYTDKTRFVIIENLFTISSEFNPQTRTIIQQHILELSKTHAYLISYETPYTILNHLFIKNYNKDYAAILYNPEFIKSVFADEEMFTKSDFDFYCPYRDMWCNLFNKTEDYKCNYASSVIHNIVNNAYTHPILSQLLFLSSISTKYVKTLFNAKKIPNETLEWLDVNLPNNLMHYLQNYKTIDKNTNKSKSMKNKLFILTDYSEITRNLWDTLNILIR